MPELLLHIARGGGEIGKFTLEEVRELAQAGFLVPTDEVWFRGLDAWEPLEKVLSQPQLLPSDWRDKVIAGATVLSGVVGRRVGRFVAGVKARAVQGQDAITQAKAVALEQFLPQFQQRAAEYLRDKPVAFARAAAQNDAVSRNMFGAIYDCLPKSLCRFVSEADFVAFCMAHRQRLLAESPSPAATSPPADDAPRT